MQDGFQPERWLRRWQPDTPSFVSPVVLLLACRTPCKYSADTLSQQCLVSTLPINNSKSRCSYYGLVVCIAPSLPGPTPVCGLVKRIKKTTPAHGSVSGDWVRLVSPTAALISILNNGSKRSVRFMRRRLPCYYCSVSRLESILCPATAGGLFEQKQPGMKPAQHQTAGHVLKITSEQERKHFRIPQR